jgi:hypothetical protein
VAKVETLWKKQGISRFFSNFLQIFPAFAPLFV